MPGQLDYFIVDVFAREKYAGNQLAVFLDLDKTLNSQQMLAITREINFSETTFVRNVAADSSFEVRIFTREYEVPFAGHPTLGTAYILAEHMCENPVSELVLKLKKGAIPVQISKPKTLKESRFTMQQAQPEFGAIYDAKTLAGACDIPIAHLDVSMPIQEVDTGLPYLIIFLNSIADIGAIKLNTDKVEKFLKSEKLYKSNSPKGLTTSLFFITTETVEKKHQYHTRMFVLEGNSIWEDAATGSANGCFLAYLLKHQKKQVSAIVEQGFEMGRESILYLDGAVENNKYILNVGGQVVPISQGTWEV